MHPHQPLALYVVTASPWIRGERTWLLFLLKWPINLLLWLTVPNARRYPRLKYLTFLLTLIWIAGISYVAAFAITIIGR